MVYGELHPWFQTLFLRAVQVEDTGYQCVLNIVFNCSDTERLAGLKCINCFESFAADVRFEIDRGIHIAHIL